MVAQWFGLMNWSRILMLSNLSAQISVCFLKKALRRCYTAIIYLYIYTPVWFLYLSIYLYIYIYIPSYTIIIVGTILVLRRSGNVRT